VVEDEDDDDEDDDDDDKDDEDGKCHLDICSLRSEINCDHLKA